MEWVNSITAEHWSWIAASLLGFVFGLALTWRHSARTNHARVFSPSRPDPISDTASRAQMLAHVLELTDAAAFHQDSLQALLDELDAWTRALKADLPDARMTTTLETLNHHLPALRAHAQNDQETSLDVIDQAIAVLHQHLDRPASARHEKALAHLQRLDQTLVRLGHSLKESEQRLTQLTQLLNPTRQGQ